MSAFVLRNVVKAYYTAGVIYDVLLTFGELSEEIGDKKKYAKYKAAYIHNCLKNGETPIPGPPGENDESSTGNEQHSTDDNHDVVIGGTNTNENTEDQPNQNKVLPQNPDSILITTGE